LEVVIVLSDKKYWLANWQLHNLFAPSHSNFSAIMGFVEDELKQLKEVIGSLDSRIKHLEKRATGSSLSTEEIRMIIMGPPGAGKRQLCCNMNRFIARDVQ
jgi:tRNA U34 5-carboxymethylaminomethyl modifying GTPase MnmE/TrmE